MKTGKARYKPSKAHACLNLLVVTFIFKHSQKKKKEKKTENISLFSIPYALQASSWIGSIFRVERVQEESSPPPSSRVSHFPNIMQHINGKIKTRSLLWTPGLNMLPSISCYLFLQYE